MDEYDQPPKKKASIILRKESCGDAPYFMPLFNPNQAEGEKDVQNQIKCLKSTNSNYDTENNALSQSPTSHLKWPSTEAMPQMSKLSMNIGYARHLANTSAMNHNENQSFPGPSQGPSDPISFASFNLLSKRQAITNRPLSGLPLDSSGNPLSTQQAYYAGVREAQRQPPCQDYPMQSQQLSSMYACAKNSSSINDFKLLMVQSSPTDFSNGNDGSIWQPRLKSVNSASTNTTSISNSAGISHSNSFEDIECYDYDDIPSFDEAMDMMAARIL